MTFGTPKYDCVPCPDLCADTPTHSNIEQTLFLGLTIVDFTSSVGWNEEISQLTVRLKYDECVGPKVCYDSALNRTTVNTSDPGFEGLTKFIDFQTGNRYHACQPKNPQDVIEKTGRNILGAPVYFRFADFEYAGIVSDWTQEESSQGETFRVKIVDPRQILEGVYLITGKYSGRIDRDFQCVPIPSCNIFNVYGYMEQFGGVFCPPVSQNPLNQYNYILGDYCDLAPVPNEGAIFGAPNFWFGGSIRNDRGMPLFRVLEGFNLLANSLIVYQNQIPFSTFGRVVYCSEPGHPFFPNCGYLEPDNFKNGFWVSEYLVDLSELPTFGNSSFYRIEEDCLSLTDLVSKVCSDAGCDYYWQLVLAQDARFPNGIAKFIKLRVADRRIQPPLGSICSFINNSDCFSSKSIGAELRNEETSSFVIGGNKETIYQVCQDPDPEGNGPDVLTGYAHFIDLVTGDVFAQLLNYVEPVNNQNTTTPAIGNNNEIDDMIVPYFGCYRNGNIKVPYLNEFDAWTFWAETSEIAQSLNVLSFGPIRAVRIDEFELRSALDGFESWQTWAYFMQTDIYAALAIFSTALIVGGDVQFFNATNWQPQHNFDDLNSCKNLGEFDAPRDINNPKAKKRHQVANNRSERRPQFFVGTPLCPPPRNASDPDDPVGPNDPNTLLNQNIKDDLRMVYEWVLKYAQEYYGKQFQVRVPFTCCFPDLENLVIGTDPKGDQFYSNTIKITDQPTSSGWTEFNNVLGIPTHSNPMQIFKNDRGKITPFVRFSVFDQCGTSKDISRLSTEDYLVYWQLDDAFLNPDGTINQTFVACGYGPPTGVTSPGVYIDVSTGDVYYENNLPANTGIFTPPGGTAMFPVQLGPEYSDVTASTTTPGPENVLIRIIPNTDSVRIWNGTTWILFHFGLFVRAEVEEQYKFVDATTCFSPRVVVRIPDRVALRKDSSQHLDGANEVLGELALKCGENDTRVRASIYARIGAVNRFYEIAPRACLPNCTAVPIRSNVLRYGPWYRSLAPGKTKIIKDDQLNPWNFGSYATMNLAGETIAEESITGMKFGEIGSINIPGFPCRCLGSELNADNAPNLIENRNVVNGSVTDHEGTVLDFVGLALGVWTGTQGPNITNVSFTFNPSQGPSTNYSMRTFAPRQGYLNKYIQEKLSFARSQFLDFKKEVEDLVRRQVRTSARNTFGRLDNLRDRGFIDKLNHPVNEVVMGENMRFNAIPASPLPTGNEYSVLTPPQFNGFQYNHCRPLIATQSTETTSLDISNNFKDKAAISFDGFFRSISMDGDGGLPPYVRYHFDPPECATLFKPQDREDPDLLCERGETVPQGCTEITLDYLNPFSNPQGFERSDVVVNRSDSPLIGHDIEMIARGPRDVAAIPQENITAGLPIDGPEDGLIMPVAGYDLLEKSDYRDDYRPMALRGPLVISGWGYDLDGFPVPNKIDDPEAARTGAFAKQVQDPNTGEIIPLQCKFMDNWLRRCDTWPVAPVDLRLDRERGVWTVPTNLTSRNFVCVIPCEDKCDPMAAFPTDPINLPPLPSGASPSPTPTGNPPQFQVEEEGYFYGRIVYPLYQDESGPYEPIVRVNNKMCVPVRKNKGMVICLVVDCEYYAVSSTYYGLTNDSIPGWNPNEEQVLGHDEGGCLEWLEYCCDRSCPCTANCVVLRFNFSADQCDQEDCECHFGDSHGGDSIDFYLKRDEDPLSCLWTGELCPGPCYEGRSDIFMSIDDTGLITVTVVLMSSSGGTETIILEGQLDLGFDCQEIQNQNIPLTLTPESDDSEQCNILSGTLVQFGTALDRETCCNPVEVLDNCIGEQCPSQGCFKVRVSAANIHCIWLDEHPGVGDCGNPQDPFGQCCNISSSWYNCIESGPDASYGCAEVRTGLTGNGPYCSNDTNDGNGRPYIQAQYFENGYPGIGDPPQWVISYRCGGDFPTIGAQHISEIDAQGEVFLPPPDAFCSLFPEGEFLFFDGILIGPASQACAAALGQFRLCIEDIWSVQITIERCCDCAGEGSQIVLPPQPGTTYPISQDDEYIIY